MVFPIPKREEYFDGIYKIKGFNADIRLYDLYMRLKDNNLISYVHDALIKKDAYILKISDKGIEILYSDEAGRFYAIATLKQLIGEYGEDLPYCEIADDPDFERRGYMLDISRCRMPKMHILKQLIDMLSELKYNELQLYMDSFCFKYSAYPKYTEDFDCLTPEDIVELDRYCSERYIDLVPNQNCFGHMKAWLVKDELKHLEVSDGVAKTATLNILDPESEVLVENIFESLLPHFKSEYVNIGLDEAGGLGKYQLKDICDKKGRDNVFMDYLNKISELCMRKYSKKVMFWNDMVYNYPNSFRRIPEGATALHWGYDLIESAMSENKCRDLCEKGVRYYVCPSASTHITFTGRFDVMSFNLRTLGELGKKYGATGYLMTDWGCGEGHMAFPVWSLIPAALAAQYAWNAGVPQNGEGFKTDYIYASQRYVDDKFFGGRQISKHLYRLGQYYLLEPERVHCGTMCGRMMRLSLTEKVVPNCFDISKCGDDFYFDNVIAYINKGIADVEKEEIPEQMKREIILNSKMVILATEFMRIRYHGTVTGETVGRLIELIDEVSAEYYTLWTNINYEKGVEDYLNQLLDKKAELESMV